MMKRPVRRLCAGLVWLALTVLPLLACAQDTAVFIPSSAKKMRLPSRPGPVSLYTYADNDGRFAFEDGDFMLFFSSRMDYAAVDWKDQLEVLDVDSDGFASASKEGHDWQQSGVVARLNGVNTRYSISGMPEYMWVSNQEDYFSFGQRGAWSTVYWRNVTVKTDCGQKAVWFVSNVTTSYPYGEWIRSVSVDYCNDRKNSLSGYTISYAVSETEVYTIRYDENDVPVRGYYNNGERTLEHAWDEEAARWVWRDAVTKRTVRDTRLRAIESFPSPRTRR